MVYVTCPHRCGCFICYASSSKSTIHVAEMLDSTNDIAQITGVNKKVLNSELSRMSLSYASLHLVDELIVQRCFLCFN